VYVFVDNSVKKAVVFSRETEETRCAMQHHVYLHMHVHCAVHELAIYQATVLVHRPMHMLCMKAVACIT
jgi:hypothetical protein